MINYLCANPINKLLGVDRIICLLADDLLDDSGGFLVDELSEVVEDCLIDFGHFVVIYFCS